MKGNRELIWATLVVAAAVWGATAQARDGLPAADVTFTRPLTNSELTTRAQTWSQKGTNVSYIARESEGGLTERISGEKETPEEAVANWVKLHEWFREQMKERRGSIDPGPAEATDIEVVGDPSVVKDDPLVKEVKYTSGCPANECASPFTPLN